MANRWAGVNSNAPRQVFAVKRNKSEEYHLQCWLACYLAGLGVLFCANSGSTMKTSLGVAIKIKNSGYRRGFPDMFIYEPRGKYHGMAIELKVNGYPDKEGFQKKWRDDLEKKGYYAVIVPRLKYMDAMGWVKKEVDKYLEGAL